MKDRFRDSIMKLGWIVAALLAVLLAGEEFRLRSEAHDLRTSLSAEQEKYRNMEKQAGGYWERLKDAGLAEGVEH